MQHDYPGPRLLLLNWAILMGLTAASMVSAQLLGDGRLQPLAWWSALLIALATYYKARQVCMIYLNLRVSSPTWKGTLSAFLLLCLGLIGVGYWLANYLLG